MAQDAFERASAFFQSAPSAPVAVYVCICVCGGGVNRGNVVVVANIATINHKHNRVADLIIRRPHAPERVLPAHVPDLEVHVREGDGSHILADGWHGGFAGWRGVGVEGFYGGEERGFAGVVEAEQEDRVFWGLGCWLHSSWIKGMGVRGGELPSLEVAQK